MTRQQPKKRSTEAQSLEKPQYRQRVVHPKRLNKKKPTKKELEELMEYDDEEYSRV